MNDPGYGNSAEITVESLRRIRAEVEESLARLGVDPRLVDLPDIENLERPVAVRDLGLTCETALDVAHAYYQSSSAATAAGDTALAAQLAYVGQSIFIAWVAQCSIKTL